MYQLDSLRRRQPKVTGATSELKKHVASLSLSRHREGVHRLDKPFDVVGVVVSDGYRHDLRLIIDIFQYVKELGGGDYGRITRGDGHILGGWGRGVVAARRSCYVFGIYQLRFRDLVLRYRSDRTNTDNIRAGA